MGTLDGDYSEEAARAGQLTPEQQALINKKSGEIAGNGDAPNYQFTPEEEAAWKAGLQDRTVYHGPGAADYGGKGGAAYYKQEALNQMGANDAEQASNAGALQNSLRNMKDPRGLLRENSTLSGREDATRNQQLSSLELNRQAAMGNAPSLAAGQTRMGMNDIMGSVAGSMGSARGLSALGGAQAIGGQAMGQSASGLGYSGGMARSKEIGDAIGMYGSQAGGVRDQDLSRLGQNTKLGMSSAQQNDAWQVGNANLAAQQANLGNAQGRTDLDWLAESQKPAAKQFEYDQQMAAVAAGADADASAARLAKQRDDTANRRGLVSGAAGVGLGAVGSLAGPAGAAAGSYYGSEVGKRIP